MSDGEHREAPETLDLGALEVGAFTPLLGRAFRLRLADAELELELVEATALPAAPGAPREPFALLFAGPERPVLAQGVRSLEHPALGRLEPFLVPLGPAPDGRMRYEAVFG